MTKPIDSTFIQIIHPVCCGLDIHKDKISACLITLGEKIVKNNMNLGSLQHLPKIWSREQLKLLSTNIT